MITASSEKIEEDARRLIEKGYRTIKLKVGRHSLNEDIVAVKALRTTAGNGTEIRLDANRAWSLKEAVSFGKSVADCRIQYIEEPLKEAADLTQFFKQTGIPFALDESLVGQFPNCLM